MAEYKDKMPSEVVDSINSEIAALRGVLDSEDADAIRAGVKALGAATMKIGEALNKGGGGAAPAGDGAAGGGASSSTYDADVKEEGK